MKQKQLEKKMKRAGIAGKRSLLKNFLLRNEFVCSTDMLFGESNRSSSCADSRRSSTSSSQEFQEKP